MTIVHENVTPIIENTTMTVMLVDGTPRVYTIKPIEGYILHVKARDFNEFDPETGFPSTEITRGYTRGDATCGVNYDFTATTIIDGYTAYGSNEFFARPESEVPADQIN